jgi:hypothetical protein
MSHPQRLAVSNVRLVAAPPAEATTGLLGWISCTLNGSLRLDGLGLRRTAAGDLVISFPARRDAAGRQHPYVRPVDEVCRRDIEYQILAALGLEGGQKP